MSVVPFRPNDPVEPGAGAIPAPVRAAIAARTGDVSALPALRRALAEHPDLVDRLGDLAGHVERGLVALVAGPSPVASEAVTAHVAALRADLGEADAPPLERLLVRRVALCWLACHAAEVERAERLRGGPAELLREADKRVDRAHGRLLTATRTLAAVRRLAGPALRAVPVAPSLPARAAAV